MRSKETKELYVELTKYIGSVLVRWNTEGWLDKEIYERTGVLQTRLTEIKNYEKYGRPLTEKYLAAFLGGGVVTVAELIKNIKMSDEAKKYLMDLGVVYGNKELVPLYIRCLEAKIDPIAALKELLKNAEKQ